MHVILKTLNRSTSRSAAFCYRYSPLSIPWWHLTALGETSTIAPSAENPPLPPCSHLRKGNRWEDTSMPHPVPLISLRRHQQNEPRFFRSLFFSVAFSCSFLKCTGAFSCLGFNQFDSPPATQRVPPGCPTGNPCLLPGQFIPPFPRDLSSSQETTDIGSLAAIPMSSQEVQGQLASPEKPFTRAVVALPPPSVYRLLVPAPSRMGWHIPQELELVYFKNSNYSNTNRLLSQVIIFMLRLFSHTNKNIRDWDRYFLATDWLYRLKCKSCFQNILLLLGNYIHKLKQREYCLILNMPNSWYVQHCIRMRQRRVFFFLLQWPNHFLRLNKSSLLFICNIGLSDFIFDASRTMEKGECNTTI